MGKNNNCLFGSHLPIQEVQKNLGIPGAEVKIKKDKKILVNYNGEHFVVSKEKEGYRASVDIPGYLFWVIWALVALLLFFVLGGGGSSASADSVVPFITKCIGGSLPLAFLLYWICAEIYSSIKKKTLMEYCHRVSADQA